MDLTKSNSTKNSGHIPQEEINKGYPNSKKIYVEGELYSDLKVGMREISLGSKSLVIA